MTSQPFPQSLPSHLARPELARQYADELTGKEVFSNAPNGLFLAGARRTGKTQFLKQDLAPDLQSRGLLVVYADLWAGMGLSPLQIIARQTEQAIQSYLAQSQLAPGAANAPAAQANVTASSTVTLAGVPLDLSLIGKPEGMTLPQVFALWQQHSKQGIALIIDEAQHALTSKDGEDLMRALKSARDQLRTQPPGLLLVMSGSHRDKLMRLVNSSSAPFWGSQVRTMPTLGQPFVRFMVNAWRRAHPEWLSLDEHKLVLAFQECGERPDVFKELLGQSAQQPLDPVYFADRVLANSKAQRERDREGWSSIYQRLEPLPQAVFTAMLAQREHFQLYGKKALAEYQRLLNQVQPNASKVTNQLVQKAMDALREHEPPLVWKSQRGDYSLYDQELYNWYDYLKNQQSWPPQ